MDNRLSILLAERLISITELSVETGLSRPTLTDLYYRRATTTKIDTLIKICDYLCVPLSELIEYVPERTESEV